MKTTAHADTAEVARLCLAIHLGELTPYEAAAWLGLAHDRTAGVCDFFPVQEKCEGRARDLARTVKKAIYQRSA